MTETTILTAPKMAIDWAKLRADFPILDQPVHGYPLIYFGASLRALCLLAQRKGYSFVGCNSSGVNAFFVRRDKLPPGLSELSPSEGFVKGRFTETRDERGLFVPVPPEEEHRCLLKLPLVDVSEPDQSAF